MKDNDEFLSDLVHSELGEKYWIKNMDLANSKNYKTLMYHSDSGKVERFDKEKIDFYYKFPNIRFYIKK